ncbi:unnamed protein product [Didymodactylos carnosus]|uniref:ADP ribosyltransferase domain-containing protein n=1 Tax=Didymodactylos carnosus TaxID=1234261 RepID=A0A815E492_9BILA|nr:unnamed protein product [Didymodactylos carnosus]CAF4139743.1 unnamed protein product [Didymodactylos carnosus]
MEKCKQSRRLYGGTVQNFLVVWLNENIDEENNIDCQNIIIKLREVVNAVNIFTNIEECVTFISDIRVEKVFVILSGAFDQIAVPMIHDMIQISTIYIFCENKARNQEWVDQWSKIEGIFTNIQPIFEALKKAIHKCNRNTISMSFVPTNVDPTTKTLDQLDQSFMYTQILKEILLTIDFQREHFETFITYCREQFVDNPAELRHIEKFENEYHRRTPIWWYSHQCFLYSMLNRALRIMDINLIIKLGFFLSDLHQHITRIYSEQYCEQAETGTLTVYRGQGLSQTDFNQLIKTQGGLLSFNNFLSTSLDRQVSLAFTESYLDNPYLLGILFEITVNSSTSLTPYANVRDISHYREEQEILFSMHSIFRIREIKQIDDNDRLWQVELTLTGDHDTQLHALTEHIRAETSPHEIGWKRLGQLLIKLGQFDKAQQVYDILLVQTADHREKANIYHHLGTINRDEGKYAEAITYAEKSLEINQKILPPEHPDLAATYYIIGFVYHKMSEYSKALSYHEKALEIRQKILSSNHHDLASSYSNIDSAHAKALSYDEEGLKIQQKTLPLDQPDLAECYNHIGTVYFRMGEYSKALSLSEKALEIREKTHPSNHPDLALLYSNIGRVYNEMNEYSKALLYHEKALNIRERFLPPDHPYLANSYSNIGRVYHEMGEYSKALSCHEKALEIREKTHPLNQPELAVSYNNIGAVYNEMNEYSKALSYLEKAFEIRQKALPKNHPDLALSYNNIGRMYNKIGEYSKAFSYHEKAHEIWQKVLPENHRDLALLYNDIGLIYDNMREYPEAFSYYSRAVEIGQRSLPENHSRLQEWKRNLENVEKKL